MLSASTSPTFIQSTLANPILLVPPLAAVIGILFTWKKFRDDSLRRGDVLAWADDCITAFENVIVAAILFDRPAFKEECLKRLIDAAFDSAALIERGRIFFKNQPFGSFGNEKPPAYRGFRPKILDPLVAAHQIAVRLVESHEDERIRLQILAEDYLKEFVSLVQKEIGRERTAAAETKKAGAGFRLQVAMNAISSERIDLVKQMKAQRDYRVRPDTQPAKKT
jgi:hypothetical protein